jgi:hypothetical protein
MPTVFFSRLISTAKRGHRVQQIFVCSTLKTVLVGGFQFASPEFIVSSSGLYTNGYGMIFMLSLVCSRNFLEMVLLHFRCYLAISAQSWSN